MCLTVPPHLLLSGKCRIRKGGYFFTRRFLPESLLILGISGSFFPESPLILGDSRIFPGIFLYFRRFRPFVPESHLILGDILAFFGNRNLLLFLSESLPVSEHRLAIASSRCWSPHQSHPDSLRRRSPKHQIIPRLTTKAKY